MLGFFRYYMRLEMKLLKWSKHVKRTNMNRICRTALELQIEWQKTQG